jgi:hypothetical protein
MSLASASDMGSGPQPTKLAASYEIVQPTSLAPVCLRLLLAYWDAWDSNPELIS